jgi:RNA polymerase sigma factor (sigma-70 family)
MSLFESVGRPERLEVVNVVGFDDFYRSKWDSTVRLAFLLTGSAGSAEDAAQEAFTRVHRHFDRVDNPPAFLRTVVVNVCRNWQRSQARERARYLRLGRTESRIGLGAEELCDVVDRLPYRQRAVIVLRYWADLSEAEIASCLECRPGTVKTLASQALTNLRKEIPR